ncbi:MAG: hypothetical protein KGM98_14065, partial [Bacteroidota bacterium]|nr:hypothetical protein [Bacteroidota bacterium]
MPSKETIEQLYRQYLNNDISAEELESFLKLLEVPDDELTISALMDGTWREMFEEETPAIIRPLYKRAWFRAAAAAVIILVSAGGYFFFHNQGTKQTAGVEKTAQPLFKNDVAPGGNNAILTLSNGKQIVLDSISNGTV